MLSSLFISSLLCRNKTEGEGIFDFGFPCDADFSLELGALQYLMFQVKDIGHIQSLRSVENIKGVMMNNHKYEAAKERVKELKDFYNNLISYITINIVLIIINLITNPRYLWFRWVTIFWGIGILLHASKVFLYKGKFLGKDWEEKKIKEIMGKEVTPNTDKAGS